MTSTRITAPARALGAAAMVLAVTAGCGVFGGGDDGEKDEKTSAQQTIDPERLSPSDLPEAPKIADAQGAVKDVTVGDCPSKKGENVVSGEVKNSSDDDADYVITISWITPRSDVVGRGVAEVKGVGAGETSEWKLTGSPLAKAGSYSCTTHVLRGDL